MDGLENSKCILCIVTKEYSQSDDCKRELTHALSKSKPHAILMLDHYDDIEKGIQLQIINEIRINFYKNKGAPSLWLGEFYEKLTSTISPHINSGNNSDSISCTGDNNTCTTITLTDISTENQQEDASTSFGATCVVPQPHKPILDQTNIPALIDEIVNKYVVSNLFTDIQFFVHILFNNCNLE